MMEIPSSLAELADLMKKLPGVGKRSALRLAFHILNMPEDELEHMIDTIDAARHNTITCEICGSLSESSPCKVCADDLRDPGLICVVSFARDVFAMESMSGSFNGKYHVLGGVLSPMKGIGPQDLSIEPLIERVKSGTVREVIFATNPDVEGDATASYIASLIKPLGVRTTRLAHGIPIGGTLEYVDTMTLGMAVEGRRDF